jgi:F420-dependent methylenetetrahydromethanopterin dehydrogenase
LPSAFARKLFGLTQIGTLVQVNSEQLAPALMLDRLVLSDQGATVVTFTPGKEIPAPQQARADLASNEVPVLAVDPGVFRMRLRFR